MNRFAGLFKMNMLLPDFLAKSCILGSISKQSLCLVEASLNENQRAYLRRCGMTIPKFGERLGRLVVGIGFAF
jgi:hypothetical protein